MREKTVSGIIFTLLLMSILTWASNVQPVKASGTTYIRADGSVDPPTAPISNADNVVYTFTDNIYDSIVVERNNITIDGNGYAVEGAGSGRGIDLSGRNNITMKNTTIKNFYHGIYLRHSSAIELLENHVTHNNEGIRFWYSLDNRITGNSLLSNDYGIVFAYSNSNIILENSVVENDHANIELAKLSCGNCITNNNVTDSEYGIWIHDSAGNNRIHRNHLEGNSYGVSLYYSAENNTISRNNITNNDRGIYLDESSNNILTNNTAKSNNRDGILLYSSSNNTVAGNEVTSNNNVGICLWYSSSNIITNNIALSNEGGICLYATSNYNTLTNNTVLNNGHGTHFESSSNNILTSNTISNNNQGIYPGYASNDNIIYLNNFIDNIKNAYSYDSTNIWDSPEEITYIYNGKTHTNYLGNYWSDYTGVDLKRGLHQEKPGSDGIGDTPYIIDKFNRDRYPLMSPWTPTPPKKEKIKVTIAAPRKGEIFFITATPRMPSIICSAQVEGMDPGSTDINEFFWEAHLSYTWKHRGELRSQSFTFKEKTIGGSWIPDFGSVLMGGNMEISVAVTIGGTPYRDSISIEIRGENPDKETIKAELGELKYQILAYLESKPKWHHFDKKGLPIFGPPSGYGLMQLDPPPSYKEIWDWKANIKAGKEHFDKDIEAAGSYAAYVRDYYGGKEPVTELSDTQILRQAYYSYRAGRAYWVDGEWWPYYIWDTERDTWIVNKKASSQGTKYADQAMEYLEDIPEGEPPKNW